MRNLITMPDNMVYCKASTLEHHLSRSYQQCLLGFDAMITKEGQRYQSNNNWVVLDLDAVEALKATNEGNRNRNSTCDFTIGIRIGNVSSMLLVECRLNYESPKNISVTEINDKVRCSINLIGQTPPVNNIVYFLFKEKVKPMAYRKLRLIKSNRKEYLAATVGEFVSFFNSTCSRECRNNSCIHFIEE